ncbi:hypothetical protein DCC39_17140 [Pueribacillus theae]|uniref:Uncharacterized protein n=1 Tax=Pueribacillus theae TaxID=2171751 RepID=A0A2U1JPC6_9BACI|nr:hypothetical protein [Pueribacillus theae]PWA06992.1 hypothetical protein DCC39_17140 [Pueribacillus theae]
MSNANLELKKAIINRAYRNHTITKEQYNLLMKELYSEEEKIRLQQTLKSFKKKELIERYRELIHS